MVRGKQKWGKIGLILVAKVLVRCWRVDEKGAKFDLLPPPRFYPLFEPFLTKINIPLVVALTRSQKAPGGGLFSPVVALTSVIFVTCMGGTPPQ